MQEQAFLDELDQLGLLEIEDSIKWKMHRLDITQDFYVKCDPSLMVKIIRYAGSVDPYRKGRALHYNQHNEIRSCKFEKTWYDFALYDKDEPELTDKIHHKKKIAKALEKLEINDVIIPCRILNDRQCGRFPCPPLCTRVQGL